MLRRLVSFSEKHPRTAAKAILALAIALILVALSVLVSIIDFGERAESPYPSEVTPLSWTGSSVVWTGVDTIVFNQSQALVIDGDNDPYDVYAEHDGWGRNYSSMYFLFRTSNGVSLTEETWHTSWGRIVANDSQQSALNLGTEATITIPLWGTYVDGQMTYYSLAFTDLQGNGAFDRGDLVTMETSPRSDASAYGDPIYTLALVYLQPLPSGAPPWPWNIGEFSFAFHNGEFYSWQSHVLNWEQPWWE